MGIEETRECVDVPTETLRIGPCAENISCRSSCVVDHGIFPTNNTELGLLTLVGALMRVREVTNSKERYCLIPFDLFNLARFLLPGFLDDLVVELTCT